MDVVFSPAVDSLRTGTEPLISVLVVWGGQMGLHGAVSAVPAAAP